MARVAIASHDALMAGNRWCAVVVLPILFRHGDAPNAKAVGVQALFLQPSRAVSGTIAAQLLASCCPPSMRTASGTSAAQLLEAPFICEAGEDAEVAAWFREHVAAAEKKRVAKAKGGKGVDIRDQGL